LIRSGVAFNYLLLPESPVRVPGGYFDLLIVELPVAPPHVITYLDYLNSEFPENNEPMEKEKQVIPPLKDNLLTKFLEGPKNRQLELRYLLRIFKQFLKGFRVLHFVGPCITVFGSARFGEEHPYYQLARRIGAAISKSGFTVMTGGGPGIMEGANRGAFEAGGMSVGCNIRLPYEQLPNDYMQKQVTIDYFFVRKVLLMKYSYAFVVLPGGWGTMDEFFETLTLIQTGIIQKFPVVLMGKEYHQHLLTYMQQMLEVGTISAEDLDLVVVTDDVDEAMEHISTYVSTNYQSLPKRKPIWWLLEKM
jgi:uncharacterized protein (TIGR00730 family)